MMMVMVVVMVMVIAEQGYTNLFPAVAQNDTALRRRRKTAKELRRLLLEATRKRSKSRHVAQSPLLSRKLIIRYLYLHW